jgi:hypothetical protein
VTPFESSKQPETLVESEEKMETPRVSRNPNLPGCSTAGLLCHIGSVNNPVRTIF